MCALLGTTGKKQTWVTEWCWYFKFMMSMASRWDCDWMCIRNCNVPHGIGSNCLDQCFSKCGPLTSSSSSKIPYPRPAESNFDDGVQQLVFNKPSGQLCCSLKPENTVTVPWLAAHSSSYSTLLALLRKFNVFSILCEILSNFIFRANTLALPPN